MLLKFCFSLVSGMSKWGGPLHPFVSVIYCPVYLLFCTLLSCVQVWWSLHLQIQRLSGVDSDFASFLHHAGVPSVDLYYGRGIVLPFLAKPDQTQIIQKMGFQCIQGTLCPIYSLIISSFSCRFSSISHSIWFLQLDGKLWGSILSAACGR